MTRVVLIGPDSALEEQSRLLLEDQVVVFPPAETEAVLSRLFRLPVRPQLVVFGPYVTAEQTAELAARLRLTIPSLAVAGSGSEVTPADAAVGISFTLAPGAELEDVDALFVAASDRAARAAAQLSTPRELRPRGEVVVVTAPKGGVGKTTIATNVALVLAAMRPHETVLVDLDLQFGDVAEALALEPTASMADAVGPAASRDVLLVKHALTPHSSGLLVLAAPPSPVHADRITARDIAIVLRQLAQEYAFVVVDTAPGLSEHTLAAIDEAAHVISVTSPDITSVHGLTKELSVLRELSMIPESHQLVLNLMGRGARLAEIEGALGHRVGVVVPRTGAVGRSTNRGVPVVIDSPRDRASGRFRDLATRIAERERPTRSRRSERKDSR
ncbi:pilus assembly protein CpaE [Microbacteriaceae bacterium SG_E_30_P1]|uniref:Pilus assembly protein CpaE n=1 Tax=Antiquaquibacter oligotrophicus TaxID=2880260 RepID=A0ABT6KQN7_9MICO|nr:AAA family ATPase [Antiquaquibacter oligotrophicus]MDH6182298.1 pilus assembly protein CpaE [Antiquaquibacter oligotrophicus]UDF12046.1 AAA family ATPase [Antiquaquibacter oligotrophicus]